MENDTVITPTDPYKWLEETIYKIRCISDEKSQLENILYNSKVYKINKLIDKKDTKIVLLVKFIIIDDLEMHDYV